MNREPEYIKIFKSHYQDEINSSYHYGLISQLEKDNQLFSVYKQMSKAQLNYDQFWKEKLEAATLTFSIGKLIGVAIGG